MLPDQSKATFYSARGDPVPAFPEYHSFLTWDTDPFDQGVGGIIEGTVGESWSFFNFLNRIHFLNGSSRVEMPAGEIALMPGVCGDVSSATANCSDVCGRPSDMFGSLRTLWHCLTLASLTIADASFPDLEESTYELIHTALRNFSITSAADFPGELVLNNTFECAFASCKAAKEECKMKDLNSSYIVNGHVQLNVWRDSAMKLCEGVEAEIDADIAGPGVVISYIFQAALAVYVWVFISLPKAKASLASLLEYVFPHLSFKMRCSIHPWPIFQRFWATLVYATSTFLVEFHEAQCFFVTSIEIALLYAKSRPLPGGSENLETLYQFRDLIRLVGSTGALSVIISQTCLYRARLNSVYYAVLSTITLALAIATVTTSVGPSDDKAHELFGGLNSISECGGNASLRSYCLQSSGRVSNSSGSAPIYLCVAAIVIIWLFVLVEVLPTPTWVDQMYQRLTRRQRAMYTGAVDFITDLIKITFIFLDIFVIVFLSFSLVSLRSLQKKVGGDEWGVGQVIAVLIWAPVLSKYFYLILFGIERGFLYRLSRSFMVVKRPRETENDGEGSLAPGDEDNIARSDEENVARSDEGDTALGDATGADTVPLMPIHRNTAAW